MKKKVTIYDVAEAADVSLATVSRVINGSNVVKPATRERVLETIKRLDFKPNQIARGLATSKTTTIAVVFPQSLFGHVKDMIGGIGDTGRTLDFNIIMYTTDELGLGNPIEEVIEKVIKSRADGVVLFNNNCIDKEIDLIKKYRIPAVVVGYKISDEDICSVYVDAKSIAYDMTKQFIEQGKKDICFVRATQNLVDLNDFAKGIEEAFKDSGETLPEDYIVDVSNHYEESYPQLKEYFDTHKHDVVLTGYDKEAVAVVNAAIDHGINVPEDMQVVGMMDTSYATICRPPLTTIHVPVYDMGEVQNVPAVLGADGRHVALCSRLVKRPVEHVLGNGEDRRVVVGDGGNFPVVGAVIILVPDIVAQLKERLRRAVALGKRVEIVPNVVVRVRARNGEIFEVNGRIIVVAFLTEEGDVITIGGLSDGGVAIGALTGEPVAQI